MSEQPLISVIVPVYNVQDYLTKCVESILRQNYQNLEIILINDGSTDTSGQICDQLKSQDNRIVVVHKENGGLSDARNVGLECARGTYITFIDSDDWISSDYISCLYNLLIRKKSQIAVGSYISVSDQDCINGTKEEKKVEKLMSTSEAVEALLYQKGLTMSACCKLYVADLWKKVRFPVGKLYEDVLAVFQVVSNAQSVAYCNQIIYFYLQRTGGIVRNNFSSRKMDYVYNMQIVKNTVMKLFPELERAAVSRLFWAEIHVFVHLDKPKLYPEEYAFLKQDIKHNRRSVLLDKKSRLDHKVLAVLSFGGHKFIRTIFMLIRKK